MEFSLRSLKNCECSSKYKVQEGFLRFQTPTSTVRLKVEGCRVNNGGWVSECNHILLVTEGPMHNFRISPFWEKVRLTPKYIIMEAKGGYQTLV